MLPDPRQGIDYASLKWQIAVEPDVVALTEFSVWLGEVAEGAARRREVSDLHVCTRLHLYVEHRLSCFTMGRTGLPLGDDYSFEATRDIPFADFEEVVEMAPPPSTFHEAIELARVRARGRRA